MPTPPPLQSTFLHATEYASLFLQMIDHLFPGTKYPAMTDDQRRIAQNETDNLLTRSKWRIESKGFAETFSIQQAAQNIAPAGTVLGAVPAPAEDERQQKFPGQYA